MRSRAAYKLIEIDDKYHFLKPGLTVVDLGAAPGGWSQVAAKRVGAADGKGKVVAIDLLEMPEIAGVSFAQLDFLSEDAPDKLLAMIGGRADVVLSDMAANTTGHRKTDQLRILGLVEGAAAFAADVLKPGGTFVAKVFQSGADAALMSELKRDYASVGTSSRPRAGRIPPSVTCWRRDFADDANRRPSRHSQAEARTAIQSACGKKDGLLARRLSLLAMINELPQPLIPRVGGLGGGGLLRFGVGLR